MSSNGTHLPAEGRLVRYSPEEHPSAVLVPQIANLLKQTIEGGASMTFVPPVTYQAVETLWTNTLKDAKRTLFLWLFPPTTASHATKDAPWTVAGTAVLLDIATGTGPFRAKVEKLMVAPEFQRRGIAERLMRALEDEALAKGLYYITLGTETNCPAEAFYKKIGYTVEGILPEYIVSAKTGRLVGCTHFYKRLDR